MTTAQVRAGGGRFARWAWGALLVAALCVAVAWWMWERALAAIVGGDCSLPDPVQLDLHALSQLRARSSAYRADPSSPLVLSPAELSWVVSESFATPMRFGIEGAEVLVRRPVRWSDDQCVLVAFRGPLTVTEGQIDARVNALSIAGWSVPVPDGLRVALAVRDWEGENPSLGRAVHALRRLRVEGGAFLLTFDDPTVLP